MKGLYVLGILIAVAVVCGVVPFALLPGAGIGVGLPVIYVPGEALITDVPVIGEFTNTMLAAILTTLIGWLIVIPVAANLKERPGRMQSFVEMLVETFDNLTRSTAGPKGRQLFPLMISFFLFLLVANLMKTIPGVDTIGLIHCAGIHEYPTGDFVPANGYPKHEDGDTLGALPFTFLKVEEPLDSGDRLTEEQYDECYYDKYGKYPEHHGEEAGHGEEAEGHGEEAHESDTETASEGAEAALATAEPGAEEDHSEEAAVATAEPGAGEDVDHSSEDEAEGTENQGLTSGDTEVSGEAEGEEPGSEEALDPKEYKRYIVTPFVRGASTDLSLTFGISLVAWFAIQFFGIKELGVGGYGSKYLNIPALARVADGQGMAIIDFAVGLLETVLEIMKAVSFAFRLFGAMFGGQILMFVITFLAGTFVPVIVFGLEAFVGVIQAFVFSMLFLMFSNTAMTSHHHDDDEHHDDHHH